MPQTNQLSKREKEVVELLLQGKSNKQIALILGIAERTVEFHLSNVYTKLNVSSRTEAILQLGKATGNLLTEALKESTVDDDANKAYATDMKKKVTRLLFVAILILTGIALIAVLTFLLKRNDAWKYEREGEFPGEATVGKALERSNASGQKVHGQFGTIPAWPAQPGCVTYNNITIPETDHLYLELRYSKYSPATVQILISIDDEETPRARTVPEDQGGWNRFVWTDPILLGKIENGVHSLTFCTGGQQYGVADLDKFVLYAEPR